MLRVNLPVLGTIHPQSNKFVTGVRTKAIGDSERNDSLGPCLTTFPNTEERENISDPIPGCIIK